MRIVLHPEVRSDIDAVMAYYEHTAGRELRRIFTQNCDVLYWRRQSGPSHSPYASAVFAGSTFGDFLTIFYFAFRERQSGFSSFGTIEGILHSAWVVDSPVLSRARPPARFASAQESHPSSHGAVSCPAGKWSPVRREVRLCRR